MGSGENVVRGGVEIVVRGEVVRGERGERDFVESDGERDSWERGERGSWGTWRLVPIQCQDARGEWRALQTLMTEACSSVMQSTS